MPKVTDENSENTALNKPLSSWMIELNTVFYVRVYINPLTPMSDKERISPYNINTMLTR